MIDLLIRRREMLVGEKLPYDAKVEYLQSSGTQYINLRTKLDSSKDVIDIEFMLSGSFATTSGIFGAREDASVKNFSLIAASSESIVIDINNGNYSTYRVNSGQSAINKQCVVHMERSSKFIKYDGVQIVSSSTTSQSFVTNSNAYLFGVSLSMTKRPVIIYSFKWTRNGDLLFDMIPVRKNGVGYMYDKVSEQLFGNVGTGSFTYGNDV